MISRPASALAGPAPSMMDKVNILLVDDQPGKLLTYQVILEELGENLVTAGSANEALDQLLRHEIAVVLTDVSMPGTDGFELAEIIRQHPRFQRTAIIFVSAIHLTDPDRLRGYAAGAVDYLPVPLVPELMRAKVKVFAELYRKTQALEQLNRDLERRVEARTTELALANAELEQRVEERTREREAALAQVHELQKMESLGQLTGGVAHDFNNLLMAVSGNLELLKKRLPEDPALNRLIAGAIAGADRGATLTKRMLAFARRQELKPAIVQLSSLVEGMEDMLRRSLGPPISMEVTVGANVPPVRVDAHQFELALLNLALNARDAMPEGGRLTIVADLDEGAASVAGLADGEYVCVLIADSGVGMDEQTLKQAAEPFFTTKGVGKGTGLGLPMAQGLVVQSGGAMHIASQVGVGTSIRLWLPVDRSGAAAERRPPEMRRQSTRSYRVLVVDDDPLILSSTAALLEDLGHLVTEASSGQTALEILHASPEVDVIVADFAMPAMTGAELAGLIRQSWPWMPVILASGYADLMQSEHAQLERLAKPYTQAEIAACIEKVLEQRKVLSLATARRA